MAQKCLFKFQTESDYNTAKENGLITPNISMIVETGNTYINADVAVTAYYNVQDITAPTMICGATSGFKSMEVDGVLLDDVVVAYQFDTTGEHVIKYELIDPKAIGGSAFQYCAALTSVTIGNGVTTIGDSAFYGCTKLTSVTIGGGVTSIGLSVFDGCSGLENIVVKSGNTVYDSRDNCNAIIETATNTLIQGCKNTVIPNSVTSIGKSAFRDCSGLTEIAIPNGVTTIDYNAFYNCNGLTNVTIGSGVTSIGNEAFASCESLTSITIPNGVTSIGQVAFEYCEGLTSITIGSGVTSIGYGAFNRCSGLTSITSLATTAPAIDSTTFMNVKTGGTLTVPSGSTGYDTWMGTDDYYLGKYNWTKNDQ